MEDRYTILASDGLEYSDLTEDLLKVWHGQHRVDHATQVRAAGEPSWRTLGETFPWAAPQPAPEPPAPTGPRCVHHADRAAVGTCSKCAEPCCGSCLDPTAAAPVCAACLQASAPSYLDIQYANEAKDLAKQAFMYSLVGFLCFGFVLGPIAISKGIKARNLASTVSFPVEGMGRATAGIWIGAIVTVLHALAFLGQLAKH